MIDAVRLAGQGAAQIVTPARLIMAVFFMHAFVLTNWFPRIPDIQHKLQIGPGDLSLGLLGSPVGTLIALPFAGAIIERLSPRLTIMIAFTLYCIGFTLPGWAWNVPSLFAALFVFGLSVPVVDVAMNVEADRIERSLGRRIMNTCHGFWSVGTMFGSVTGAGFAALMIEPRWHMLIIAVVALPIALTIARALPQIAADPLPAGERPPRFALPSLSLIGLCAFSFGMLLVEGAALDWSAVYMRDVVKISAGATGLGFGAFALFMAIGRLLGDRLAERYGPVALARTCCLTCFIGIVGLVTATSLVQAVISLAAAGFGVSVAAPLSVSAAAGRGDRPAAVNVAALSLIAFSAFLVEPPLIGFASEAGGLRIGMAMVIPMIVMSTLLAGQLRRRTSTPSPPNPLSEIAT
jgi:MFS family permease